MSKSLKSLAADVAEVDPPPKGGEGWGPSPPLGAGGLFEEPPMTPEQALEVLRRNGYAVFHGAAGEWWCRRSEGEGWLPPVDDQGLVNRAETIVPVAWLKAIRRRYGP